jgi:hypothetical protein
MDLDPASPKKPPMPPIDLRLAINFIPAVVCLCKAALISFSLSILRPGEHLGGFVIFVMVLNRDRAVSSARIFDENAVQCCIVAARVINFLRVMAEAPRPVVPVTTFLWCIYGLCLLLEPRRVQEFFVMYGHGSGGTFKRILPGILTSLFAVVMAFTPLNDEPSTVKSARSVGFACLCVAWVYVVSIWRPKPRNNCSCVFECHLLLSRFCPILYVHWIVAILYSVGCVGILLYHYVRIHVSAAHDPAGVPLVSDPSAVCPVVNSLNSVKAVNASNAMGDTNEMHEMNTIEEDDEDLEAYFRTACQNRQP